jgi:hypothetical protein
LTSEATVVHSGSPPQKRERAHHDRPCDINSGGLTTVADVQIEIDEALAAMTAVNDLNRDGAVNLAEVQKPIDAALGLGCPYGAMELS